MDRLLHRRLFSEEAAPLKPRVAPALAFLALLAGCYAGGLALSATDSILAWLVGQALVATAMVQAFVVLHEAEHATLLSSRPANAVLGCIAGIMCAIPSMSWRIVHREHHMWTGWRDVDPTSMPLVKPLSKLQSDAIDICWRNHIPLLSVVYRLDNYWHLPRLMRLFGDSRRRLLIAGSWLANLAVYALLMYALGAFEFFKLYAVAYTIHLVVLDPIIICQHCHIPYGRADGRDVKPVPMHEQDAYTRSVRYPPWFSRWVLMGFDAHEKHHLFPGVPGYRLDELNVATPNCYEWRAWLSAAKQVPGHVLMFQDRSHTGLNL